MTDTITLTGLVATAPRHLVTSEGVPITSFRLASQQRHYDRKSGNWVDGATNWYTVTAFRSLAINAVNSLEKGQRVVAHGKLRISDWESGEKRGTNIELDADALGHDLSWGTSVFSRSIQSSAVPSNVVQDATVDDDDDEGFPPGDSTPADSSAVDASAVDSVEAGSTPRSAEEPLAIPF